MKRHIFSELTFPGVSIDSTFDTATVIELTPPGFTYGTAPMLYKLAEFEGLTLFVSNIAGGATELTIRICFDSDCDSAVLPEVAADIVVGVTTASAGSVTITGSKFAGLFPVPTGKLYCIVKTNAGTCDVDTAIFNWRGAV